MFGLRRLLTISPLAIIFFNNIVFAELKAPPNFEKGEKVLSKFSRITSKSDYILGSGDGIAIIFEALDKELSGQYIIGPDGSVALRRVGKVNVNGLTLDELKDILIPIYSKFVINPDFDIYVYQYKSISIYIGGEVRVPGLYELQKNTNLSEKNSKFFPTLFDAIKAADGITNYSNLEEITLVRKDTYTNGGGLKKTKINLLPLFTEGDQRLNIDLYDGDSVFVARSDYLIRDQFLKIANTNLNPKTIRVFVSGNVQSPGMKELPKGSGLIQAIAVAGGQKSFTGNIEFLRFTKDGKTMKRKFKYNLDSNLDSYENPILISGDIVNINQSAFGVAKDVIADIAPPITNTYGIYKIFGGE